MPSEVFAAFRAELLESANVLAPQLRGLEDLSKVSLKEITLEVVRRKIADHVRRWRLIKDVIDALDKLEADGFPGMHRTEVNKVVLADLKEEGTDIDAALDVFEIEEIAARNLAVKLGETADKS